MTRIYYYYDLDIARIAIFNKLDTPYSVLPSYLQIHSTIQESALPDK